MELNGEVRQHGFTKDMLFTVDEIISHISRYMTLRIGDLIYTGTPVGVVAVKAGDNIKARIGGYTLLDFDIM
jgi:2-keto-4-pentenoate hydratase/2-oxohepta-3-ene-1,7-dioic acid hydratase in catechol pathway